MYENSTEDSAGDVDKTCDLENVEKTNKNSKSSLTKEQPVQPPQVPGLSETDANKIADSVFNDILDFAITDPVTQLGVYVFPSAEPESSSNPESEVSNKISTSNLKSTSKDSLAAKTTVAGTSSKNGSATNLKDVKAESKSKFSSNSSIAKKAKTIGSNENLVKSKSASNPALADGKQKSNPNLGSKSEIKASSKENLVKSKSASNPALADGKQETASANENLANEKIQDKVEMTASNPKLADSRTSLVKVQATSQDVLAENVTPMDKTPSRPQIPTLVKQVSFSNVEYRREPIKAAEDGIEAMHEDGDKHIVELEQKHVFDDENPRPPVIKRGLTFPNANSPLVKQIIGHHGSAVSESKHSVRTNPGFDELQEDAKVGTYGALTASGPRLGDSRNTTEPSTFTSSDDPEIGITEPQSQQSIPQVWRPSTENQVTENIINSTLGNMEIDASATPVVERQRVVETSATSNPGNPAIEVPKPEANPIPISESPSPPKPAPEDPSSSPKEKAEKEIDLKKLPPQEAYDACGLPFSLAKIIEIVDFDNRENGEWIEKQMASINGVTGMLTALKSNREKGLSQATIEEETRLFDGLSFPTNSLVQSGPAKKGQRKYNARQHLYGENKVPPPPPTTIISIIIDTVSEDRILQILIVASILSLILGMIENPKTGYIEGLAIFIAVFLVLTITATNDYSKEQKFNKILLMASDKKSKVIRDGNVVSISSWEMLVGDVAILQAGDEVPADGLFLRTGEPLPPGEDESKAPDSSADELNPLKIDESPLTGETLPVVKSAKKPYLFSGCQVSEGSGLMLVTTLGSSSSAGKIQEILNQQQKTETPLQLKLADLAIVVGKIGFVACGFTFFGMLAVLIYKVIARGIGWTNKDSTELVHLVLVSVTVVVVAVPEGLPLAVAISLAFSVFKMIKDNIFVRHLSASEIMGEATCICTDKTGTLTENRMSVVKGLFSIDEVGRDGRKISDFGWEIHVSGDVISSREYENKDHNEKVPVQISQNYSTLLAQAISCNSNCFVKWKENEKLPIFLGSATEGALLVFLQKMGHSYDTFRAKYKKVDGGELAFTSARKRMTTLIGVEGGRTRLLVKGASEIVLGLCKYVYRENGSGQPVVKEITKAERELIFERVTYYASQGLRTIIVAFRDFKNNPLAGKGASADGSNPLEKLEEDLIYLTLVGIKDPVRAEVPRAVSRCQTAGLVVRMVTGDNIFTASFIAQECGIVQAEPESKGEYVPQVAIEGPIYRDLKEEEKLSLVSFLRVLARSSPSDKFQLVQLLKKMGEVVSVTGDGTNDAPALKEADVGFAMGQAGTQIARNASDMVLLDDNFASLVRSIAWGRNVLDCVRKFLQFQLSVNFTAITFVFIGNVIMQAEIFSVVQLLWVNLIMDTIGALALASEAPTDEILLHHPHKRNGPLITRDMWIYMFIIIGYEVIVILLVLELLPLAFPGRATPVGIGNVLVDEKQQTQRRVTTTYAFTTFILLQCVNIITTRQLELRWNDLNPFHRFFRNPIFVIVIIVVCFIQVLVVQFGKSFCNTEALNADEWLICTALALGMFIWVTVFRVIVLSLRSRTATVTPEQKSPVIVNPIKKMIDEKKENMPEDQVAVAGGKEGQEAEDAEEGILNAKKFVTVEEFQAEILQIAKENNACLFTSVNKQENADKPPAVFYLASTAPPPNLEFKLLYDPSANLKKTLSTASSMGAQNRWNMVRSAAFFISHYQNVADDGFVRRGPDESFITSVRKFRY